MIEIRAEVVVWPVKKPISIARGTWSKAETIVVSVSGDEHTGRGECTSGILTGVSADEIISTIDGVRSNLEKNLNRVHLAKLLPPCPARNALDCAIADYECKTRDVHPSVLLDVPFPIPVRRIATIPLGLSDDEVLEMLGHSSGASAIKLKVNGWKNFEKIAIIRKTLPEHKILIDANESWDNHDYISLFSAAEVEGVSLIEQPFSKEKECVLTSFPRAVPVCVDETFSSSEDLPRASEIYDFINIKLDKAGGITEAVKICKLASQFGLGVMVGCNLSSSLGIAPSILLGTYCAFVDLDSPTFLAKDYENDIFNGTFTLMPSFDELWGGRVPKNNTG